MMKLVSMPSGETPLYSHSLPALEAWLTKLGCARDDDELHRWHVDRPEWSADIYLEVEELAVIYLGVGEGGEDINRSFRYSLSREDVEAAVFEGP